MLGSGNGFGWMVGARAGVEQAWHFFQGRRDLIGGEYATQEHALWLEEAIDRGDVEIPPGATELLRGQDRLGPLPVDRPHQGQHDRLRQLYVHLCHDDVKSRSAVYGLRKPNVWSNRNSLGRALQNGID